ncbi:hypothetical protein ACFVIM_31775 [Streptomyces sp. NPDC057638]|uniref:hypothetical protein n=1 Tax=Streptomyces sp. NPDC057638 TaxID=3346190 RepID=UPI0036AD6184
MGRHARPLIAAALSPLLLAVWAVALLLTGAAPAAGASAIGISGSASGSVQLTGAAQPTAPGTVTLAAPGDAAPHSAPAPSATPAPSAGSGALSVTAPATTPPSPTRTDHPHRATTGRPDLRRAPPASVPQQAEAADQGGPPPLAAPVAVPVSWAPPVVAVGTDRFEDRRERAPPHAPYDPRHSRAPPFATSR